MRKSDFHYDLPAELIAQRPLAPRSAARLLCLDRADGGFDDRRFADLLERLHPGDVLVLNDTRVIAARLLGHKQTGGRIEVLIERVLEGNRALALVRASKPPAPGQELHFGPDVRACVTARRGEFYELAFAAAEPLADVLERHGQVPLPPYIARPPDAGDRERYQTVYARAPGAVAAPTAGLHFDRPLLARLADAGIELAWVTLHVGAGTFQPLRGREIVGQRLHAERVRVTPATCDVVNRARAEGRRIVAVGTTVVRALEAAAREDGLAPLEGETDIFIYPGFHFRAVDALVTNFHLPESSLLMLVCAFGGTGRVFAAYRHAVQARYRFYSYGDAMYVVRAPERAGARP